MNQELVDKISSTIITHLSKKNLGTIRNSTDLMNYINRVAETTEGLHDFNMDYPEEYEVVYSKIKAFLKENKNSMNKKVIKEFQNSASQSIPTPRNMLNYKDDAVVASIKQIVKDKFDNFEIERIQANSNQFFNVVICMNIEEMPEHFELMKYTYIQKVHQFKIDFFTEISKILPVVNITVRSFEFIKDTEQFRFYITLLLSDTNISDWVTGKRKPIDTKEKKAILDKAEKESVKESKVLKEGNFMPKDLWQGKKYEYTGGGENFIVTYDGSGQRGHLFSYISPSSGKLTKIELGPYDVRDYIQPVMGGNITESENLNESLLKALK